MALKDGWNGSGENDGLDWWQGVVGIPERDGGGLRMRTGEFQASDGAGWTKGARGVLRDRKNFACEGDGGAWKRSRISVELFRDQI